MLNRIDLSKYNVRTDLAIEVVNKDNIGSYVTSMYDDIEVTRINLNEDEGKAIDKESGSYITISFDDVTDFDNRIKLSKVVTSELSGIISSLGISSCDSCLVVGLGNDKSTPDALGSLTIKDILVTRHLFVLNENVKEGIRNVCVFTPGVMGENGIETFDIIKSIIGSVKPDFVITIDSLKASSIDRVNKTIQITDTGIAPGSGVGNNRVNLNKKNLGIPIIAIGVPTVVDTSTIMSDTLDMLIEHLAYIKSNINKNKLVVREFGDYKKKVKESKSLSDSEKKEIMGMLGDLDDVGKHMLFEEVLNRFNYNLIVTPKEIDYLVEKLSNVLSSSINRALHESVNHY